MHLPPDYHIHTPLCQHAEGEPAEYAAKAFNLGLKEIGFSDHAPRIRDGLDDWRMKQDELEVYVEKVNKAQKDYPMLKIKLALEVDYLPKEEEWIRDLANRFPWDYLIGSVHYLAEDWAIDDPSQCAEWENKDIDAVWTAYIERLVQAADSKLFDIVGHADLCKKFAFYPQKNLTGLWNHFLLAVKKQNMTIELNTAGLYKDCREIYPSPTILMEAQRLHIPITFGSDAHKPEEVARNFNQAVQLAQQIGYKYCCHFTKRQQKSVLL